MKIVHKLSLSFVLMLFFLSLSMGMVFWNSLNEILVRDLVRKGNDLAANLAELSQERIQTGNLYALYELIYLAKNNHQEVRYALIMDAHGKVMVHTFQGGIPSHLLEAHPIPAQAPDRSLNIMLETSEGKMHDILYPIGEGELGYIRIGLHERSIRETLFSNLSKAAWIVLALGLFTLGIAVLLTDHFTRHLLGLTRISEAISKGQIPDKMPVTSSDEIGKLSHAINTMVQNLKAHEEEEQYLRHRLINSQEDERKRISRELHDETGQALTALILSMRAMANQVDDPDYKQQLLTIRNQTADVLERLRHLAVELRPPILEDMGLLAAMQKYIDDYRTRHSIAIEFAHSQETKTGSRNMEMELALYRILQECLTNIVKHSRATSVQITFHEAARTTLLIKDNGIGLPKDMHEKTRSGNHLGLHGIQERVDILHGQLSIFSQPPEWPTVIQITLPVSETI